MPFKDSNEGTTHSFNDGCGEKAHNDQKNTGDRNGMWKGDKVGYKCLHKWVQRKLGNPKKCEHCGTEKAKKYEWANISREYKRDMSDWVRLCGSCHRFFDGKDFCKRGHALVKDNLYVIKNRTNWRICKKCTIIRNKKYRDGKK